MASDDGLITLGKIYVLMDLLGVAPSSLHELQLLLARKHKGGGRRCIGHLYAFIRVHGKLGSRYCKEWEREHGLGAPFSASQGRSPEDT
eukprot:7711889-Pyramimonas_sp.AAC.1